MKCAIHPTAIVENGACLADDVAIGAFAFIGGQVRLDEGVVIHSGAVVTGQTTLESQVEICSGAIIGGPPQIYGHKHSDAGRLTIAARTIVREQVTVNTGSVRHGGLTHIGEDCLIMIGAHVAHDCRIGRKCIVANGAQFAGHVIVGEHVWFGGVAAVHQRCRIGDHAFIAGGAILVGDVIPYATAIGNRACLAGLNITGLKRNHFAAGTIRILRTAYRMLHDGQGTFDERLAATRDKFHNVPEVMNIVTFIKNDRKRALCQPR